MSARTALRTLAVLTVPLALLMLVLGPRVVARATGEEIRLRAAPVDPMDPFRGAYVALDYPDLLPAGVPARGEATGPVFVVLERQGEVWVARSWQDHRPDQGTYLSCEDAGWQLDCGIGSWFTSQAEASEIERELADRDAVATVRVDGRGRAVLAGLDPAA